MLKNRALGLLVFFLLLPAAPLMAAGEWDMVPPLATDDLRWQELAGLWDNHWDGKNIDRLIGVASSLEKDFPARIEPKLWLARLYFLKAKFDRNPALYKRTEEYAVQAHRLDSENILAFKFLMDALPYIAGKDYALERYGAWINAKAPLPCGYLIPAIAAQPWQEAFDLWTARDDIAKGAEAVTRLSRFADDNPGNLHAQTWACRVNYDLGQYYSSLGEHETKAMPYYEKGMLYGQRAMDLDPNYIPAGYWYTLNLARSIQFKSLLVKAANLKTLVDKGLVGLRENGLYNYYGSTLALATMITNGGWVAEKGLVMVGIDVQTVLNQLDLAEIVYPDKLYIIYGKADLYHHLGRDADALREIRKIYSRANRNNPYLLLENPSVVRFTRILEEEIGKSS